MNPRPSVKVYDEYDQPWDLTPEDTLYPEYAPLALSGAKTVIPLAKIIANRGWGWWSSFRSQDEWLAGCGIPMPTHNIALAAQTLQQQSDLLQQYGSYVTWLEAQVGIMEGRRTALKQAYEAAIMVRSKDLDAKLAEKAKEATILGNPEEGSIRLTKQLLINQEAQLAAARGLLAAYQRAWETVSRVTTIKVAEAEAASTRRSN